MESSQARGGLLYWLLVAAIVPGFNWWLALWILVLARDAVPLLIGLPVLLIAESLGLSRLLRGGGALTRPLGTATLLVMMTLVWSFVLTLAALTVQGSAFTF
jgi:hypothetical protein